MRWKNSTYNRLNFEIAKMCLRTRTENSIEYNHLVSFFVYFQFELRQLRQKNVSIDAIET